MGRQPCDPPVTTLRTHNVLSWATRGGAAALARSDDLGTIEVGKKADLVLLKNDDSPVSFPLLNPHGHVVLQAQRSDVHTVLVNGHVAKYRHRLRGIDLRALRDRVENTVEHQHGRLGESEWHKGTRPRTVSGSAAVAAGHPPSIARSASGETPSSCINKLKRWRGLATRYDKTAFIWSGR
ncbi:amidohydrolase family protein [Streptomyces goshikiensis]|uniref:amidohydrolase family protein n=1 Tax=Streptomyces goshikiensis TaxID=1942 RepID=UPI003797ECE5